MSKSKLRSAERWGIAMTAAAACVATSANAYTMPGGTITFRGALVSPPFAVAAVSAQAGSATWSRSGQTAIVAFDAYPNSTPNAAVSLRADNHRATSDALTTDFVDGNGRRIAAGSDGAFRVGGSGGVLSIESKARSAQRVTVVTEYR
ncbi:hypothetical protein P9239_14585 [Caballeronia sp. LZ062]|uniref:hypothetical protein n=1 Tax=unclassified Caballeronia TaxID=2646786 RepID=UPI002857ADF5|nr:MULTISPECIES: hypothetical protein [unclassified Caballeronia]MDR5853901.1 hypothetical protein [Caballeronia sp. LZ050]MDR5871568.1 hypothetical protein [Caballeronia sp. LZ062]